MARGKRTQKNPPPYADPAVGERVMEIARRLERAGKVATTEDPPANLMMDEVCTAYMYLLSRICVASARGDIDVAMEYADVLNKRFRLFISDVVGPDYARPETH